MRDEFTDSIRRELADRAGHRCSNPDCGVQTTGPTSGPDGRINIGVAAHISAASPGGPRYDPAMAASDRASAANGIWLCQTCAKLVDADMTAHPTQVLLAWKCLAEARAQARLGRVPHDDLPAVKEIVAKGPGTIGREVLLGPGAEDETIVAHGNVVGERIHVENGAIGEPITNRGGRGKRIIHHGPGPALQIKVGEGGGTGLRLRM